MQKLNICARSPPDLTLSRIAPMMKRLLPFQQQGVRTAIERKGKILIADDMGLGKTIQGDRDDH